MSTTAESVSDTSTPEHFIEKSPLLRAYLAGNSRYQVVDLPLEVGQRLQFAEQHDTELVHAIEVNNVEGLHGTRSGSLLSIMRHGLLTQAQQQERGLPTLTGEHFTQSEPRDGTHVVHWLFAGGTRRYAEEAMSTDNAGLSLGNYQDALAVPDEFIDHIDPTLAIYTHFKRRKEAAEQFDMWVKSGDATEAEIALHEKNYPVIVGVSLDGVSADAIEVAKGSVPYDCKVKENIDPANVRMLFVPETEVVSAQELVGGSVSVVAVERLRSIEAS